MARYEADIDELRAKRKEEGGGPLDARIKELANELYETLRGRGWQDVSSMHLESAFDVAIEKIALRSSSTKPGDSLLPEIEETLYAVLRRERDRGSYWRAIYRESEGKGSRAYALSF